MRIELTKLTKDGGPLTKRISLSPDGTLVKDGSACVMWQGAAERIRLNGVDALAALIESLTPSQALALGALCPTLPDKVEITTKKKLLNGVAWPDVIARTGDNIIYHGGQPAFALLDYDSKGMPTAVAAELECVGGFWVALCTVLPALGAAARVTRRSTSAGLSRADTGEVLPGSDGVHVYVEVKDGADNERFLRALHDRCWLAGLGWMMVSRSGALLERSIIDRMVGGPERLVFEGGPVLEPPLQQDEKSRHSIAVDGVVLDTVAVCPPLTVVEMARLEEFKAKESHRLAPEVAKAKAAFIERQAKKLAERTGIPEHTAKHIVLRQCDGVLRPDIELPFDDPELTGCTVGDVLADPDRFVDKTLADPLEGVDYGPSKAKIMRRADGSMWINSFAHGRTTYELKHSAASVRKAMTAAVKEEVVTTFTRLVVCADVDAVELEELRQLAAEQSGVGLRVVDRALKAARRMHAEDCNREMRRHRAAQRLDPRPRIAAPLPDAQFLPTMDDLNAVIGKVDAAVPPLRDIAGVMTRTRKLPIPKMHGFTETEANPEEEPASCTAMRMTKLPAPEQWVLSRMNEMECAEMIEQYIDYYVEDKNGERRSVHLNREFVKHYLQRHDGVLPTAVAIATSPIVLPDGMMLAPEGLDREHGIVFVIPKKLRAIIPESNSCTPERVREAMNFLCDEWLCDVVTGYTGKATIIAAALTLIERSLLPDRPAFFVTAGRRGGGKTTTLIMSIVAVTGLRPAAAAWSTNEEERRKALLSYLLYGMPYILWDNIARGTQISCPHIEKSCTSAHYSDRKLGVSEAVCTAAATIHLFTGNNISPRGDLASRSLHIRLDVDRADPENRAFKHPDPIVWTENHRADILAALYIILLGNPQLKAARDAEGKTRFKMWWRLVGSAVENAAKLAGQELDFQKLFITQEEDEEDSATLADMLDVLVATYPREFLAKDVTELVNSYQFGDGEEKSNKKLVRDLLLPGATADHLFSTKSIGRLLKRHLDNAVINDNGFTLVLRKREGSGKAVFYRVDKKAAGTASMLDPGLPQPEDGTEAQLDW